MTREDIYADLNEVFRDVFDDESITVTDETTSDDIDDWDSLEHIDRSRRAAVRHQVQHGTDRYHEERGRNG